MSITAVNQRKTAATPLLRVVASEQLSPYNWLGAVGKGWHSLISPLIDICKDRNYVILQVKEKYGGLRFYWSYGGSRPRDGTIDTGMEEAVRRAEDSSYRTCESCGKLGELRKTGTNWLVTRCEECSK